MTAAPDDRHRHQIVVVGGGAAGLELVTRLGDRLGKRGLADIALIERSRTHLWKPLLHSVAAGSTDPSEHQLNYLAQGHWHHFRYHFGEMIGLDRAAKMVRLGATYDEEGREIAAPRSIPYDTLVIAVGSVTNDFGTPGAAEFAVPLETAEQAVRFHHRLVNAGLRAQAQSEPIHPGQLHVAIIGAGATGTELAAELYQSAREMVAYGLDQVDPDRDIRIILIEGASRILPALPERISVATLAILTKMGVDVRTNARVSAVRADGIELASGEFIPAELTVWAAGVKGPDVLARSRRARGQPRQSAHDRRDAEDDPRSGHLRHRRLRRRAARGLRCARPAASPSRPSGGVAPRQAVEAAVAAGCRWSLTSTTTSARWCPSAGWARSAIS